jgi:hypothetical protein
LKQVPHAKAAHRAAAFRHDIEIVNKMIGLAERSLGATRWLQA